MDEATAALLAEVDRRILAERKRITAALLAAAEGMGKTMRSAIAKSEGGAIDLLGELEQRIARLEKVLRDT